MSDPNLALNWTLESSGGTLVSAAAAGVTDIVRRRVSAGAETCTLRLDGSAFDVAPPFDYGSTVTIQRGGAPWFVGRVTAFAGSGDDRTEGGVCVLSGPWWYLENLVCRQTWNLQGGTTSGPLSRLVLGQAADGSRLNSGQVITETLQSAIDAGAPFQIGLVEPDATLPLDEVSNVTCAQVIRRVLNWHPDCVAWFDHGTTPTPTFHCRPRANLPVVTLRVGQAPLTAVRGVAARPDLAAPAVVLHYETNSGGNLDVVTDAAPPDATGQEFGALVATIRAETAAPTPAGGGGDTDSGAGTLLTGGLAQKLLDARTTLPYSGEVVLTQADAGADPGAGLGTTLNLAGSARDDWANMAALVVEDETRVASGTTRVRFGPGTEDDGATALAAALRIVQPGIAGRETGSPALLETANSAARVSGRLG